MSIQQIPKPVPCTGQALVKIKAFGLNRMDLLQREGLYPLPPQAPETLGVEFSGTIEALGPDTKCDFQIGDPTFGLAYGGSVIILIRHFGLYVDVTQGLMLNTLLSRPTC